MLSEDDQRDLQKSLKLRIKQLRMYDGILEDAYDDDEEPDVFIGDGI
tara:strand:+ start:341 stop:481 length:141 start_codon:yes stop_codon:yes gene_type:complete